MVLLFVLSALLWVWHYANFFVSLLFRKGNWSFCLHFSLKKNTLSLCKILSSVTSSLLLSSSDVFRLIFALIAVRTKAFEKFITNRCFGIHINMSKWATLICTNFMCVNLQFILEQVPFRNYVKIATLSESFVPGHMQTSMLEAPHLDKDWEYWCFLDKMDPTMCKLHLIF